MPREACSLGQRERRWVWEQRSRLPTCIVCRFWLPAVWMTEACVGWMTAWTWTGSFDKLMCTTETGTPDEPRVIACEQLFSKSPGSALTATIVSISQAPEEEHLVSSYSTPCVIVQAVPRCRMYILAKCGTLYRQAFTAGVELESNVVTSFYCHIFYEFTTWHYCHRGIDVLKTIHSKHHYQLRMVTLSVGTFLPHCFTVHLQV